MDTKACYRRFIARYFALGAAGISAGFIAVTPSAATTTPAHETLTESPTPASFAVRLAAVRSAVTEHLDGVTLDQITRPPPPPFFNVFGKAPLSPPPPPPPPPPPSPPRAA